ncbi:MAG: c-type cytochrome biogenesis protein CcmI [Alphaproteobacteria bacterium]|nr:c-type cytochrome biogenesis protein CcmI [Alphaproteobacteria bacterium]
MIFWGVASVLVLAVALVLLIPVLRRRVATPASRSAHGLAVLKDQLAEIERDKAAGRLAESEVAAARIEIERRLLAEASQSDQRVDEPTSDIGKTRRRRLAAAALILFAVPAGTAGLYLARGNPGAPDFPLASRSAERTAMAQEAERRRGLVEMTRRLEVRLATESDDVEGWMLLGRTLLTLGDTERSANAFRSAVVASNGDGRTYAELGEALVRSNQGVVVPEAIDAFERALAAMPGEPRSRYYLGLAAFQRGQLEAALRRWIALEFDTPPSAPWHGLLVTRIEAAAEQAGLDAGALRAEIGATHRARPAPPGPTAEDMAAARDMTAEQRVEMIRGMVDSLAARLEENPDDVDGWRRLARSWLVLDERKAALAAYEKALERAPDEIDLLLDYARALHPPGADARSMPDAFIDAVRRVRALAPDHPEGLFFGGLVAERRGDTVTARALWSRLIELLPTDAPVRDGIQARIDALGGG